MDRPPSFDQELISLLPQVRSYARKLTMHRTAADDLTQDVAERALLYWGRYTQGTNMLGWLTTITFRQYMNSRRAGRHKYELPMLVTDSGEDESSAAMVSLPTQEEQVFLDEINDVIQVALSTNQQAAVLYAALGGSYEEIATMQNIELGTVKSRLSRARSVLAERIYA